VKVAVSLFATLAAYLPPSAAGDEVLLDVPDGATVGHVLDVLGIPHDLDCLRVVNGHDAPVEQPLQPGDVLSLFPPLAGGCGIGRARPAGTRGTRVSATA
jgi:molybdopterin converting factor small subunit